MNVIFAPAATSADYRADGLGNMDILLERAVVRPRSPWQVLVPGCFTVRLREEPA
jgi:hypothetical protein